MAGPEDPDERGDSHVHQPTETLGYLRDIVNELKSLADRSGYHTLSAILAAAIVETAIQIDEDRRH